MTSEESAESVQLLVVRPSLSVCVPFARRTPLRAAGLLLWARRAGDRHRSIAARPALSSSGAGARRSAANAGSATLSADVGS